MDIISSNNSVRLCGVMGQAPVFSHSSRGQQFYTFPLEVRRLSGNCDTVNILVRRQLLDSVEVEERSRICVSGQLRTFNNRRGDGARLVISVFAREIYLSDEEDANLVELSGTVCKPPKLRCTPMGRDICDLMLAVNRHYGRSDYLPCICWGIKAREAARWTVGTELRLEGRLQSRSYVKLTESGPMERVAFEVSITTANELVPAEKISL